MAAIQLNFSLRTSANCKTVHLIGSWDNYNGQLPLSKDANKAGGWKGTFRFQGATLRQGQRYWYYYIIDGYHVSHDPARESVTEQTTRRKLNVLDIPAAAKSSATTTTPSASEPKDSRASNRHSRRPSSLHIAKGRSLSPSQIKSPRPTKPHETRQITSEQFSHPTVEMLAAKFGASRLYPDSDSADSDSDSDIDSDVPSLNSSRSSNSSTPSSVSSAASSSSSCCTCERYGITRQGGRVKLDCGGSRCGGSEVGSEGSSECCSSDEEEEKKESRYRARERMTRRQGLVVRK